MNQLVHQSGDRLIVTTLEISNRFGRQHKDVLKAIGNLDCSPEFRQRNFAPTVYHRPNPSSGKPIPARMYELTRDGFTFLCMGFTGSQAAIWKERYIEAFNQMEAALRANPPAHQQQLALATQVGQLTDMVKALTEALHAQDQRFIGLQGQMIGSQKGHIRSLNVIAQLQKRHEAEDIRRTIIYMKARGDTNAEIMRVTGKCSNYIRQRVFIARRDGVLPAAEATPQGELNLGGVA